MLVLDRPYSYIVIILLKMKVTQPASDWSMLLRLKEGPVSMDILQTMAETYRRVYSFVLSDDVGRCHLGVIHLSDT